MANKVIKENKNGKDILKQVSSSSLCGSKSESNYYSSINNFYLALSL